MTQERLTMASRLQETGFSAPTVFWGVRWHQHYPERPRSATKPRKRPPKLVSDPTTSSHQAYSSLEECMERCAGASNRYAEICQWPVELLSRRTKRGDLAAGLVGQDRQDLLPCKYA